MIIPILFLVLVMLLTFFLRLRNTQIFIPESNIKTVPLPAFMAYDPDKFPAPPDLKTCGACFIWAVLQAITFQATILTNATGRLSVQQSIDCFDRFACLTGGLPEEFAIYLKDTQTQLMYERDYKYNDRCVRTTNAPHITVDSVFSVSSIEDMKQTIFQIGPLIAAMDVYENLESFTGGDIYDSVSGKKVDSHTVLMVGWGEDYWVIQTNWANWPRKRKNKSVFAIVAGSNFCGIEKRVFGVTARIQDAAENTRPRSYFYETKLSRILGLYR